MRISNLTKDQYRKFLKFNSEIYPARKDLAERFWVQLLDNPLLEDRSNPNILIAYNEDNQIIGQFVLMPFEYHFGSKCSKAFFGCDYFVSEEYRKTGAGALLALRAVNSFKPYFTMDVNEDAKKIHLSLNAEIIGSLYKFIWIRKVQGPIRMLLDSIFTEKLTSSHNRFEKMEFPETLRVSNFGYKLVDLLIQWEDLNWNDSILEFSRSLEFINWRFLNRYHKYYFYMLDETNSSTYFVVREAFLKGLNLLAIVDYRVPFEDEGRFKSILSASKSLAKTGRRDGVITMSSHRFFDQILKNSLFVKVGTPALILTNAKLDVSKRVVKQRNFVYATMADGDIDFNY